jgi:hypothetical protein
MTVTGVEGDRLECRWFDNGYGKRRVVVFLASSLEPWTPVLVLASDGRWYVEEDLVRRADDCLPCAIPERWRGWRVGSDEPVEDACEVKGKKVKRRVTLVRSDERSSGEGRLSP